MCGQVVSLGANNVNESPHSKFIVLTKAALQERQAHSEFIQRIVIEELLFFRVTPDTTGSVIVGTMWTL
jgi:hypothetical protein